jgi:hypothetical protein
MSGRLESETRVGRSFELQLDTPNIANNTNTISVDTSRSGVQNLIFVPASFFIAIALLLLTEPE